jgi:lysophospholipase L1-like esterase
MKRIGSGPTGAACAPRTRQLVACLGDSITRGQVSADYVARLEQRFAARGFQFVNAGVNGNLAWNVLQRIGDVVDRKPDVVTLLVGTNDVNATVDRLRESAYRRRQHIPRAPTLAWYAECVDAILARLLPSGHRPPSYPGDMSATTVMAALSHLVLRRPWSEIARRNGMAVLTDHIHLSEPGAQVVADLIGRFLTADAPPAPA